MVTANARDLLFCGSFLVKEDEEMIATLPPFEGCSLRLTLLAKVAGATRRKTEPKFTLSSNKILLVIPRLEAGNISIHHELLGKINGGKLSARIILQRTNIFTSMLVDLYFERSSG